MRELYLARTMASLTKMDCWKDGQKEMMTPTAVLKASMKETPKDFEKVMLKVREKENCSDCCSMMEPKMASDWVAVILTAQL